MASLIALTIATGEASPPRTRAIYWFWVMAKNSPWWLAGMPIREANEAEMLASTLCHVLG